MVDLRDAPAFARVGRNMLDRAEPGTREEAYWQGVIDVLDLLAIEPETLDLEADDGR